MENYAGIVTYNPNIDRLKENVKSIANQVKCLYIVDNNSNNYSDIAGLVGKFNNITLCHNEENMGIAQALNKIMEYSEKEGANWTLLLDQDSVVPDNIVQSYNKYISLEKAGVLCAQIFDNNATNKIVVNTDIQEVGICLTSGSYVNVKVWASVGKFREELFIDSVDNEYSIRLYFKGYKTYRINEVVLNHELGLSQKKVFKSVTNHNSLRRYYIARNSVLVANYFDEYLTRKKVEKRDRKKLNVFFDYHISPTRIYLRQLQFMLLVVLYEKGKLRKLVAIVKGIIDANKMKLKEL